MRVFAGALAGMGCIFVYSACAGGEPEKETPGADGGATPPANDAAETSAGQDTGHSKDAGDDAPPLFCSAAGWCETRFPDDTGSISDLWPLEGTAFAARNGIEQYDGTAWISLYDESQFRTIWAPSADEVWAGATGSLLHGSRRGGTWTWSTETIGIPTAPEAVISIWGSGADDVYAATVTKLYHRVASDNGGAPTWGLDYEDDPALNNDRFTIFQVTGSGTDDVWLLASRGTRKCSILIHKAQGRFTTLADCMTSCDEETGACQDVAVPPAQFMPYGLTRYGLVLQGGTLISTDIEASIFITDPLLQKVKLSAAGDAEITTSAATGGAGMAGMSLWGPSETDLYSAGSNMVTHSSNAFTDGGTFTISTLVLNGAPLFSTFNIRGTSASDIWIFGGPYALHKTER